MIIFKCQSCQDENKRGNISNYYEIREEFHLFSEAHQHMIENPDHVMDISIYEESEESD